MTPTGTRTSRLLLDNKTGTPPDGVALVEVLRDGVRIPFNDPRCTTLLATDLLIVVRSAH